MGKKSRKGVVRASKTRPAAGQGVSKLKSGTGSEDGRSVASRDADFAGLSSVDGSATGAAARRGTRAVRSMPPKNVNVSTPVVEYNKENTSAGSSSVPDAPAAVPVSKPIVEAPKAVEAAKPVVVAKSVVAAAAVAAPVATKAKKEEQVWKGENLREVVKADAEGPAVLDVTVDEIPVEDITKTDVASKVRQLEAANEETIIQSRGGFSLTEPADDEKKVKTDDCSCVIL